MEGPKSLIRRTATLAALVAAYHFYLRWLIHDCGVRLGAVSYKLAPLYAYWSPHLKGWLAIPAVALAAYAVALRRTQIAQRLKDRAAMLLFTCALAMLALAVAMLDSGWRGVSAPFQRVDLEYHGGVRLVHDPLDFLRGYAGRIDAMPMHAQVHPPGAILLLWALARAVGPGPGSAALVTVAMGSMLVVPTFLLARRVAGGQAARLAGAMLVLMPSVVLFTATAMDGPFALPLVGGMWLFWESLATRRVAWAASAGIALGVASLLTYSVAVAGLWCTLAAGHAAFFQRDRCRDSIAAVLTCAIAFVAFQSAIWAATGYDPLRMFLVAVARHHQIMSDMRHASIVQHVNLSIANLVVFFLGGGLAAAVLWARAATDALRRLRGSLSGTHAGPIPADPTGGDAGAAPTAPLDAAVFTLATATTFLLTAAAPLYTLEVERIWLFLMPLIAIDAARQLAAIEVPEQRLATWRTLAGLLVTQTLLTEILLSTYW
jgi:hypothetical protein